MNSLALPSKAKVPSEEHEELSLPQGVLQQMTAEQLARNERLIRLYMDQKHQLRDILASQLKLNGTDPLLDATPAVLASPTSPVQQEESETAAIAVTPSEDERDTGTRSEITADEAEEASTAVKMPYMEAEKQLLAFFSLQDTLSKEALACLTEKTGQHESQIRHLFTKWRSYVRDFIQKLQRNSSGFPVGSHAAPGGPGIPSATTGASHVEKSAAQVNPPIVSAGESDSGAAFSSSSEAQKKADLARKEALLRLPSLLSEVGGVKNIEAAESLVALMKSSRSWSVREECVKAICRTKSILILQKIANSQHMLAMVASWIHEAAKDGQTGFLGHLLLAIGKFPLTPGNLRFNNLDQAVLVVKSYKRGQVSHLAQWALQQWGILESPKAKPPPSQAIAAKKSIDPSQMAIPLSKSTAAGHKKPQNSMPPAAQKKRPAESSLAVDDAVKAKQGIPRKRQVGGVGPNKAARLDVSSLAHIKGPSRAAIAKPKADLGGRGVEARYQELASRLKHAQELQQVRETAMSQKLVAEMRKRRLGIQKLPPEKLDAPVMLLTETPQPACGEASTEMHQQANRIRNKAPVRYRKIRSDIPDSPAEPAESMEPLRTPKQIPFHPPDPQEAMEQLRGAHNRGLRLPHLLTLPHMPQGILFLPPKPHAHHA